MKEYPADIRTPYRHGLQGTPEDAARVADAERQLLEIRQEVEQGIGMLRKAPKLGHLYAKIADAYFSGRIYDFLFSPDREYRKSDELDLITEIIGLNPNIKSDRAVASSLKFQTKRAWLKNVFGDLASYYIEQLFDTRQVKKTVPKFTRRLVKTWDRRQNEDLSDISLHGECRSVLHKVSEEEKARLIAANQEALERARKNGGACMNHSRPDVMRRGTPVTAVIKRRPKKSLGVGAVGPAKACHPEKPKRKPSTA